MTIPSIRDVLNYFATPKSILVSAAIAGVSHYTGFSCLLRVKQVATGLAVTGAAIYAYLKQTETGFVDRHEGLGDFSLHTDVQRQILEECNKNRPAAQGTKLKPNPAPEAPPQNQGYSGRLDLTRAVPLPAANSRDDQGEVVQGTINQYDVENGEAACTVIAATALINMLKMGNEKPKSTEIGECIRQGAERYGAISGYLKNFGFQELGSNWSLGWDQAYLTKTHGFSKELICPIDRHENPLSIPIVLTAEKNSDEYFNVLQQLAAKANHTGKTQGGILIMSPETYAVSISPDGQTIRFFDSHGSLAFSNKAAMLRFGTLRGLANYLKTKKEYMDNVPPDYNTCALHPCSLRN